MGLVIQAQADPVIAPAAQANAGAADDAGKAPNGFAAIVNGLLGDAKGTEKKDARESVLDALKQALPAGAGAPNGFAALANALLGDARGTEKKDGRESLLDALKQALPPQDGGAVSGADAVAAALAAMQALIPPVITANPGETAGTGQTAQALAAAVPAANLPVAGAAQAAEAVVPDAAPPMAAPATGVDMVAPPVAASDTAPAAQAAPTADAPAPAPTDDAAAPLAAPAVANAQQPADVTPAPAAALSAAAAVAEAQEIVSAKPAASEKRPHEPGGRDKIDDAASPPTDAAAQTPQDAVSVVRFVGNAGNNRGNGDKGAQPGEKHEPNASVQGIAHAAANSAAGQLRDDADVAPTEVPPSPPAVPADLPPAVEHVSRTVIEQIEKGGGEARLLLHPAELGEVVIRVHADGDRVRVEIHAVRTEAMNLLRDHTADLSNLLGGRGLNLADVFVGLGDQGAGDARDQQQANARNRPQDGEFAALMGIDESPSTDIHNRLRAAYNPDGALSYRI
jgi:flagellar hook-length control protein FliK